MRMLCGTEKRVGIAAALCCSYSAVAMVNTNQIGV